MKKIIIVLIALCIFGCTDSGGSYRPVMNKEGLPKNVASFCFDGCTYLIYTSSGSVRAGCAMVHHANCKNHEK